ncbi:transglutaminase TgpA family protein [Stutzerimonas tarimensis]|uniref:DUF3488 and DUF4129 domain-containing transglutaminase family protein n=1 Tax=Stutzerimonas tarimensis TaxID=1507735 RepID=A0ABV7T392_9GAMM
MKPGETIPRNSLLWLLVAQILVILPHLQHLPLWIIALWLGCAWWRLQIYRMRALYPRSWVKAVLMLGTAFAVYLSRGSLVGLEAGAVLMIAAFILKTVEMRSRRDALVVIFLGFFAVVTGYLFDDGMLAAVYSLLPVTALLAAMIGLHQSTTVTRPWVGLRLAGSLLLQALPLMLVLFALFPRSGPLWGVPQPSDRARSGLAESIAPGDIAELSQSGALAFRVTFDGEIPPRDQLYWRAITFEHFDGQRWSRSSNARRPQEPAWEPRGEPVAYSVVMQPSGQPWLFTLDTPRVEPGEARMMADFHVERTRPVNSPLLYHMVSWPQALREPADAPDSLREALQLPARGNARTRAWALDLRRQEPEPEQLVQRLLRHFNEQPYVYTLKPPRAGADSIDDFLFDSRAGFCAHYAGAMTFTLRAAGIPARVVGGYQGGEVNPVGGHLSVHQFDAHAWVEYWLPGRGWIRVDPTFQVAPERIQFGLEQALEAEQDFLEGQPLSLLRYREIGWLNDWRLRWDHVNYGWQRWVLGYQGEQQKQLLQRWLGDLRWLGLLTAALLTVMILVLALLILRPWQRQTDAVQRLQQRYERLLARQGVFRQKGEGPRDFAYRAAKALPYQSEQIERFAEVYERLKYAPGDYSVNELKLALRKLKRRLPWRRVAVEPDLQG